MSAGDSSGHGRQHHLACGRAEGQIRRDCAGRCVCVCVCVFVVHMCMWGGGGERKAFHNALYRSTHLPFIVKCTNEMHARTYMHTWLCPSLPPSLPLPSGSFSAPLHCLPSLLPPLMSVAKEPAREPQRHQRARQHPTPLCMLFQLQEDCRGSYVTHVPLA